MVTRRVAPDSSDARVDPRLGSEGGIEKLPPVGQEVRVHVARLARRRIQLRHRLQVASSRIHPVQHASPGGVGRNNDDTAAIPGARAAELQVADSLWGAPGEIHPHQLPDREVGERAAVGRPEGVGGGVGRRQGARFQGIEGAHPEAGFARGGGGDECDRAAVGGNYGPALEAPSLGGIEREADRGRERGRTAAREPECERDHEAECGDEPGEKAGTAP